MDFHSLMEIMDKEIILYANMRELLAAKKLCIILNEVAKFPEIDTKILELTERIKVINEERINITNGTNLNITTLINYSKQEAPKYTYKLEEYKRKLNKLSKEILELYKANTELLEFGITITDKSIQVIIGAFTPKRTNYSKYGKESGSNIGISTIVKEV